MPNGASRLHPPPGHRAGVPVGLPEPREDAEPVPGHRLHPGGRIYPRHHGSDMDAPVKAVKAGTQGTPGGENILVRTDGTVRNLTVREMLRLQGFPDGLAAGPSGPRCLSRGGGERRPDPGRPRVRHGDHAGATRRDVFLDGSGVGSGVTRLPREQVPEPRDHAGPRARQGFADPCGVDSRQIG